MTVFYGDATPGACSEVDGVNTQEYQTTGPVVQMLGGLNFDIIKHLALFIEYKLNYVSLNADLVGGGSVKLDPWTNNFILGLSVYFL
jgi:hypothetical protein